MDSNISVDDDYTDEGSFSGYSSDDSSSVPSSSEPETDSEDEFTSSDEEELIIGSQRPQKTAGRSSAGTTPVRSESPQGEPVEDQDAFFARKLMKLESPEEVKRSYPPRFSTTSVTPLHMPESEILNEFVALDIHADDLLHADTDLEVEATFLEFELEDFSIYQSPKKWSGPKTRWGLEGRFDFLHTVSNTKSNTKWLVDGRLKHETSTRAFLRGEIIDVNIGGLEDAGEHPTAGPIWIRTVEGKRKDYWYRLSTPSSAYRSYWVDFIWLAVFVNCFIDFLQAHLSRDSSVCLADFKSDFWRWVRGRKVTKMDDWHDHCGHRTDFRQHVLTHAVFLHRQTSSFLKSEHNPMLFHRIWEEIGAGASCDQQTLSKEEKTVVTTNVASLFLQTFPHWQSEHELLEVVENSSEVEAYAEQRRREWLFPNKFQYDQTNHFAGESEHKVSKVARLLEEAADRNCPVQIKHTGDLLRKVVVVRIPPETRGETEFRYAWVRAVSRSTFSMVWLVLPSDTLCGGAKERTFYPIGNELFFSNECNCEEVSFRNILAIFKVSTFTDHAEDDSDFFIHSQYQGQERAHVSACESELPCRCQRIRKSNKKSAPRTQTPARERHAPKMKVCALCSGCGFLDHAFCASGFAETVLAVEHNETAVRSHQANNQSSRCTYLIDSVNSVLKSYMIGTKPLPKDIVCVIAGCPCQGWSPLNTHKGAHDKGSQKNCSILANILSWIEVFLPAYVLIENVPGMALSRPSACAQAVRHLVALGYQVRTSIKVDGEVGGVSTRKRLFIVASASGAVLPNPIPQSNGPEEDGLRGLRTAGQAIADLNPIGNHLNLNHKDPDHTPMLQLKINWEKNVSFRSLAQKISTSLSNAYYAGHLPPIERMFFESLNETQQAEKSRCLKRIDPNKPFRTIATQIQILDAWFGGDALHPSQDRVLSVREICRAMGVPDRFLLAGTTRQKHQQVGNGVPWALGGGWGREFRKAWRETFMKRAELGAQTINDLSTDSGRAVTEAASNNSLVSASQRSRLEMSLTTTKSVAAQRTRRRTVLSDDSDPDFPAKMSPETTKIVTTRFSRVSVKEETTVTVRSAAAAAVSKLNTPPQPREVIDLTCDSEEGESTSNVQASGRRSLVEILGIRPSIEEEAPSATRCDIPPVAKQQDEHLHKKRKAPQRPSTDSEDEVQFLTVRTAEKPLMKKVRRSQRLRSSPS